MQFGNLSGLINGTEQVVFDSEVSGSAVASISTGNILNGDEDGYYTVIVRRIAGSSSYMQMRFNGDTGNNYGFRGFFGQNTTVADESGNASAFLEAEGQTCAAGDTSFYVFTIYAKSGVARRIDYTGVSKVLTTTVNSIFAYTGVWNNTVDNLVSLTLLCSSGSGYDVGSRVTVLKMNNFTGGTPTGVITTPYIKGAWYRVGSTVLGAGASSVTFSSLDGDRDVVYYLSISTQASGVDVFIQPNADSTSGHYGWQYLAAQNTTSAAGRDATLAGMRIDYNNAVGQFNMFLFGKSGFLRPAFTNGMDGLSGTTVTALGFHGNSWTDTATNITSLKITAGANFPIGSQFQLYALRPNA